MEEQGPPIESVDRALQLVGILRDEDAVTVTYTAERLGVSLSTAHRLLAALVYRGYAVRDSHRRYVAGPELELARGHAEDPTVRLRARARPALEELHATTGETVELMVLQHDSIRFLDGIESEEPLRVTARIGDLMPAHCASGGKALLAELDDAYLEELYRDGLPPWPTATITELPQLRRELSRVRSRGYATNFEETERGVCSVGLAVRDGHDEAVASLVVAVPSARFSRSEIGRYVDALHQAAAVADAAIRED